MDGLLRPTKKRMYRVAAGKFFHTPLLDHVVMNGEGLKAKIALRPLDIEQVTMII